MERQNFTLRKFLPEKFTLNDKQIYIILLALVVISVVVGAVMQSNAGSGMTVTREESLEIARKVVLNSPTYVFDGFEIVHKSTMQMGCPDCWMFAFGFKSSHPGYGDRNGQALEEDATVHLATVIMEGGQVKSATLDGEWDTGKQQYIGKDSGPVSPVTGPEFNDTGGEGDQEGDIIGNEETGNVSEPGNATEDAFCGWSTNGSCTTNGGCIISGCSSQVCLTLSEVSLVTTCEWRDCYDASAYNLGCKCVDNKCMWSG